MTTLRRYLDRIYDTILSRGDIEVEAMSLTHEPTMNRGSIVARLHYFDGSLLAFREVVVAEGCKIRKLRYRYHYQCADGTRVFRYDNAPHHPELPGFPDHVHRPGGVEPADPPDLSDVLREIDGHLYGREST